MEKNQLVKISGKQISTTSRIVAEQFKKRHYDVLKSIENLECSEDFTERNFSFSVYKDETGRSNKEYIITFDGFMFLVMGFNGKKAAKIKETYIEAFRAMEKRLAQQTNVEWIHAREQGKQIRLEYTDTIKKFVEYAKSQGASTKGADMYYSNLTKMEYKALRLIEKNEKIPSKFRNILNSMQLSQLTLAEALAEKAIEQGMNKDLNYKEIYSLAKKAVINYADSINIILVSNNGNLIE